ncbi:hypothetical protein UFOVP424_34 [uncultured Caudovirales phage]|uniref:Uncharacterized protein n=1 Tax=uncultured Caudovirales phage TaxID=2100421 RepID=A0A6J5MDC6_9CAUD|nr:hypothetical protein UFOVP424_34 [uncultured Caudovirales phage]
MAQTQTLQVKIDAAINAEATLKTLRELKQLQKETVAGSADYKKIQGRINDIGDAAKTAKGQSEDWIDTLSGLPGPLGSIGRGLDSFTSSTNKLGLAFKGLGIGLIVSAIGALTAAFSQNEKMTKKLEPLMIAFEKILGGIFAALEPVIDMFIDLAVKAMPMVSKAVSVVYSGISALLQSIGKLGSALYKVFTGDFSGALDDAKSAFTDFGKNYETATKNFEKGSNELTKTEKKNLKERGDANKDFLEKQKALLESAEKARQADLDKAKAIALDGAKTEKERLAIEKKYAEDTYNSKKKLLEDQQKLYPKASKEYKDYNAQLIALDADYITKKTDFRNKDKEQEKKDFDESVKEAQNANKRKLDDLTATYNLQKEKYGENSKEARAAQDAIFAAQAQGLENEKKLYEGKKELTKEEIARVEEIKVAQSNLTLAVQTENEKRLKSDVDRFLKTAEEGKKAKDQEFADMMKAAEGDLVLQQQILDKKLEQDRIYYEKLLAQEGLTAEQRKKIQDDQTANAAKNAEAQVSIDQKKFDAQQKLLQAVGAAIMAVADIAGKNTVAGKALAVAATLINTYSAIAGALAQYSKPGAPPIPGFAIAQAVATGLVGFKAVADIIKTPVPSGGGGGGGASEQPRKLAAGGMVSGAGGPKSDLIPAMLSNGESVINAQSTSMFKPLLSSINAIGGGRRFADGGLAVGSFSQDQALSQLQSSMIIQQPPIKTYVVASDMTNQQMMDRNIKDRSTL